MAGTQNRSLHLFSFKGIDVFLHWSWFLIALLEIESRSRAYSSITWNVLEYLALFVIVLLHEFGHALACRQVGGRANKILLWPLGGIAYVQPPQRPGATLWSIAAGPLVNVVLVPVLWALAMLSSLLGWSQSAPDVHTFLSTLALINGFLLVFNLLPIYPLDGGQILRSVLWFWLGRARSLLVASAIGMVGVAGLFLFSYWTHSLWNAAIAAFVLIYCWGGLRQAQALSRVASAPRREGFACPSCKTAPPLGPYWLCSRCQKAFDTFQVGAVCPHCQTRFPKTSCLECGAANPFSAWAIAASSQPSPIDASPVIAQGTD
ncbi:MAG TPA: M50 family metallopeptidase, partial [Terriglobia bacterium]|nr:M50 family metallopeptidase [Terriglobia bacterium]